MAADGLAHQRSQGHGEYRVSPGGHNSFYKLVDSVLPNTKDAVGHEKDFFDGIDTSPQTYIGELVKKAQAAVDRGAPDEAVQPLAELVDDFLLGRESRIHRELNRSDSSGTATGNNSSHQTFPNLARVQAALQLALGLTAEVVTTAGDGESSLSAGQEVTMNLKIHNGSRHPIELDGVFVDDGHWRYTDPGVGQADVRPSVIAPGQDYSAKFTWAVLKDFRYARPYWHRSDPETESINVIDDPQYATLPFAADSFCVRLKFSVSGVSLPMRVGPRHPDLLGSPYLTVPIRDKTTTPERTLAIVPPFSVALEPGEQVLPVADGKETTVKVGVRSNLAGAPAGTLHLDLPDGWRAEPDSLKVGLPKRGDQQDFSFKVFPANLKEGRSEIRAVLDAGGTKYAEGYTLVTREDLGSAYYFAPAVQRVSIVDVKIPKDLKVGYILGAGDDIPTVLEQIGMNVTVIPAEKIATENLAQYGAIVLGVRAYDAQKDVVANSQKLLDYVFNGGTLVVQHNNDAGAFNSAHFTPYPATLGRTRVSVEEAPVTILAPENGVFHYPNEISQKDFGGWVQERGLYFMDKWDDHFTPLMSCHDPNEPDAKGGLLYAKYGKGIYIYSGYAFYRHLPAGVSGAIRLFVNLVSAGSAASSH
jgi:hypothetical protein